MSKVNRATAVVCGLLALTGCVPNVTKPVPASIAPDVPSARLYAYQAGSAGENSTLVVTRDKGYGCYMALYIDNALAARFDSGEKATFHVAPGEHVLKYGRDPQGRALCGTLQDYWSTAETTLQPDEVKRFRLTIIKGGESKIQRAD